tara:strand:- start:2403 stop:4517 length:2115 start_codon:yes stop_codon:yes gene_type:complete
MSETDLKVQIRFEATGDKELAKAFTSAANAQKKLEDVTKKYEATQRKSNRATKAGFTNFTRLSGSMGKFRLSLATLRSNLLVFTFGFNVLNRTLGKAVRAFSEQQVAVAKLNQTLRSTSFAARLSSRELQGLAANLQRLTGIGDETILSMQGVLLTFTKIKGEIFKDATEAIIDVSVAMGQDLQQSAIQVGKALNDPIIGVSALSRVGIQFTDTQKQLIKQFVRTNQIAKAQRVILDELNVQFGGTAANLDSTSFAMKRVQAAFGDFLETGGGKLAPQIERAANVLADFLEMLNNTEESRAARAFSILSEENKTLAVRSRITTKEMMRVAEQFEIISDEAMSKQGFINTLKTIDNEILKLSKQGKPLDRFLNEIMENNKDAGVTFESLFVDIDTFNDALTDSFGGLKLFGSGFVGFTGDIQEYSDTILGLKNVVVEGIGTKTQLADDIALIGALTKDGIDSGEFDDFVSAFDLLGSTIQTNAGEFNVFSPILTDIMDGTIQFNNLTAQQVEKLRILRAEFVELGATYGNFEDQFVPFSQRIENFNKATSPYLQAFDQMAGATLLFTKNNKSLTISLLKLRQALAIGNVILGFTEFLSKGMYAKAFSTLATGMTQVAQIKAQIESAREAATGADFVTNGRQLLMVGDNATGRERVQVTPLGSSGGGGGGDSSVTINLNGNILGTEDFVRDELIPQIENAVGRNLA